jgi:hypothetical protein
MIPLTSSRERNGPSLRWYIASLVAASLLLVARPGDTFVRTLTCDEGDPESEFACEPDEEPIPIRWASACVTYRFHESLVPDSDFGLAVRRAFATWSDVACSYLELEFAGTTDQSQVGYDSRFGDAGNFNVSMFREEWRERAPRIVGLTSVSYGLDSGTIYDADIEFNEEFFEFGVLDEPSFVSPVMDVENVAAHEVGHFVGLDHPTEESLVGNQALSDTTMFVQTFSGEIKRRTLTEDDIAGICAAYPLEERPDDECSGEAPDFRPSPIGFDPDYEPQQQGCGCGVSLSHATSPWYILVLMMLTMRAIYIRRP